MKIYIKNLGSEYWNNIGTKYITPTGILTDDQKKEQQENHQTLEVIISSLSCYHWLKMDFSFPMIGYGLLNF